MKTLRFALGSCVLLLFACGPVTIGGGGSVGDDSTDCGLACFLTEQAGKEVDIGSAALTTDAVAQSFQLSTFQTVVSATTRFKVTGGTYAVGSGQTVTYAIYSDNGGVPGTLVAPTAKGSVSLEGLSDSARYYTAKLSASTLLAGGVKYWLVASVSYAVPATVYVQWSANDSAATGYPNQQALYRINGTWLSAAIGTNRDVLFSIKQTSP